MAMINCPECGHDISDKAAACPKCACPISQGPPADTTRKPCPFCGEQIKAVAMKCPSCKEILDPVERATQEGGEAASVVEPKGGNFLTKKRGMGGCAVLLLVLVLLFFLLDGGRFTVPQSHGTKAADRVPEVVAKAVVELLDSPVELLDLTAQVQASSWAALPLRLPYDGELQVSCNVARGNNLDVFIVPRSEWEKIRNDDSWFSGPHFTHFPVFHASETKSYRRSGRLPAGSYYLVLRDSTLGVLSHGMSDVAVKARLEP